MAFLNDAYAGTPSTDRNLYVNDVTYDGTDPEQSAALMSTGSQTFSVTDNTAIPPVVTGGGSDLLVVKVSDGRGRCNRTAGDRAAARAAAGRAIASSASSGSAGRGPGRYGGRTSRQRCQAGQPEQPAFERRVTSMAMPAAQKSSSNSEPFFTAMPRPAAGEVAERSGAAARVLHRGGAPGALHSDQEIEPVRRFVGHAPRNAWRPDVDATACRGAARGRQTTAPGLRSTGELPVASWSCCTWSTEFIGTIARRR